MARTEAEVKAAVEGIFTALGDAVPPLIEKHGRQAVTVAFVNLAALVAKGDGATAEQWTETTAVAWELAEAMDEAAAHSPIVLDRPS
jgi:hypothetical protein